MHLAARTLLTIRKITILLVASLLKALAASLCSESSQIDSLRILLIKLVQYVSDTRYGVAYLP